MKIMYLARFGRFDLLRAVGSLATMVTKWTRACDAKLLRLIKYFHHSKTQRMIGFLGDRLDQLQLGLYTDADFVGDKKDCKSTSGPCSFACTVPTASFP